MITIDARWLHTSGIGTYLTHIIPGILDSFTENKVCLMGTESDLRWIVGVSNSRVRIIEANAEMYSLSEQWDYVRKIPKQTTLYFSPHYNIPMFYYGKMLVTVHDLFHLAMPGFVHGLHKKLYARLMFNVVRKKANAIITVSNFTRLELIRLTGQGKQPIIPIHHGVDENWFSIPKSESPHHRPYILFVGNIKPHKNLGALVKAFGSISNRISHDLVLVGKKEGFITGDKAVAVDAQDLSGRVHFTGRVDDMQLRRYFSHADALVFPSLYEGFGLPPLEAMAAGCPVLVSSAASLPEVCGDAALYCDPYSIEDISHKIMELLTNGSLRDDLRNKGLTHARQFTWEKCCDQTCKIIRNLLYT